MRGHLPVELGRDALVEGGEAQHGALPDLDRIDVRRRDLRLDRDRSESGTISMIASPGLMT
jgi:hypothetical protein